MKSEVNEWYRGRNVFVTGASGLMGKVLIEKILYSVPDIGCVYALVRTKRGKTPESRIEDMWKLPLFSRIREEKPHVMKKLIPVSGDIMYDNLGIDSKLLEQIYDEVSVVFHFAASLRLEAPLKEGLEMNTRGTMRVLDVAKRIKNLVSFVHLSTAFCYPDYVRMAEKVHDPPVNPHEVLRAATWLTDEQVKLLTPSILQKHANSYTYSKRLAEALVKDHYPELPVSVVRPSIVTPSYKEPLQGWVDNLNGPIGLMVGAGKGVIRSMYCIGHYHAEVIPVDIAINAIIVIPYYINSQSERSPEIPVFNLTSGDDRNTTWKEVLDVGKATARKYPFEGPLWYPGGNIRHNKFIHDLCVLFFHILPAYFIDFLMLIFGQKRFMVRIQNRISVGLEVLQYFTTREWWFDTNNFKALSTILNPTDINTFSMDLNIIEVEPYIESCLIGGKLYCLKEKLENLPKARLQNNILFVLDTLVSAFLFYLLPLYILVSYFEPFRMLLSYGGPFVRYLPLVGKVVFPEAVPDIGCVYALVRTKRGKTPESRIEDMWKLPLFSRIREEKPHVMKKLIPVSGDIMYDNLGIDSKLLEQIYDEVSVVFHFAASLRLEAPLKEGLEMNTRGTMRVLDVAKRIKNLVSFVHLSTAFCYPDYVRMAEKVHDPPVNPHEVLRAATWLTDEQVKLLTPSILQKHANSYTYSKRLAEALVKDHYPELPVSVVRPSIVTPSYKEPLQGWVDNLNGPIGLMVGAGKGVIRSMYCIGHYHAEVIPVDIAINAIIVIPYYINSQSERSPEIPVFNLTSGDDRNTTWKEVLDVGKATARKYPFEGPLWYPGGNIRHNKFIHDLCVLFFHILPAYLIDFLMLIFGQKRFMVRIQNRISVGLEVLQYFTTREWWFDTNNFKALSTILNPTDINTFSMDLNIIEVEPYIESCLIGGKLYCLKEKLENLPKARLQNNILFVLDTLVSAFLFYLLPLYILVSYFEPFRMLLSYGGPFVRYLPLVGKVVFPEA